MKKKIFDVFMNKWYMFCLNLQGKQEEDIRFRNNYIKEYLEKILEGMRFSLV